MASLARRGTLAALSIVVLSALGPAQIGGNGSDGPLTPTQSLTLDTTNNGGLFQFTRIRIPVGVTVHIEGTNPAVLLSQGPVEVLGVLESDAWQYVPGAGGGLGGYATFFGGLNGEGPGGGQGAVWNSGTASPAAHATKGTGWAQIYGAAFPFDVRAGSGGGGGTAGPIGPVGNGGGGGGTLVVLCDDRIDISGTVFARGGDAVRPLSNVSGAAGSGGSILIRSLRTLRVTGQILATGGRIPVVGGGMAPQGGDGFVRLDRWGQPPDVRGQVLPAPLIARLPLLRGLGSAQVGVPWKIRCAAVPGDVIGIFLSMGSANIPIPPFGVLGLNGSAGIVLVGQLPVPAGGVDPMATLNLPMPNSAQIIGLTFYVQAFNGFNAVISPRLSNTVATTVQP